MKLKYRVIERFRGKYRIEEMCSILEVSKSGYYAWRKRMQREAKDQWLVDLVTECQQKSGCTYGFRRVQLWLEREKGRHVNHKAVLRVMRKLDLLSQVRRRKPYTHYKHKSAMASILIIDTFFVVLNLLLIQDVDVNVILLLDLAIWACMMLWLNKLVERRVAILKTV